jgi:large subunit ribosomal protein L6
MVIGVTQGYSKTLLIDGQGYRASLEGESLSLQLGYASPVKFKPPPGIKIEVPAAQRVVVHGIDKQLVGNVAAIIRGFRKPEPYKGKGIRYEGEIIRRKPGKKAAYGVKGAQA